MLAYSHMTGDTKPVDVSSKDEGLRLLYDLAYRNFKTINKVVAKVRSSHGWREVTLTALVDGAPWRSAVYWKQPF